MKITCDKQQLQNALSLVARAVSSRTSMAILECVLLTAQKDKGLTLYGSDKEISIDIATIYADIEDEGSVALNAKLFTDIVRKLSGNSVSLEVDEKFNVTCHSGRSKLRIVGQPGDEFPTVPEHELSQVNHRYVINASKLRAMIMQTSFSVALDQSKLILTGELVDIKDNIFQLVAIDMFRISYVSLNMPEGTPDIKAVIPAKGLNELARMLPAESDLEVSFCFTPNRVVFEADNFRMISILLHGDFIRFDQVHNDDFSTMIVASKQELLGAFERVILVAEDGKMVPAKFEIQDDEVMITTKTEKGIVEDRVPCQTEGNDLIIYFNPRYFIEALKAIDDDSVVLKFNNVLSPCSVRGLDESLGNKYLIVPLRPPN